MWRPSTLRVLGRPCHEALAWSVRERGSSTGVSAAMMIDRPSSRSHHDGPSRWHAGPRPGGGLSGAWRWPCPELPGCVSCCARSAECPGPLVLNDAVRRRWLYANRSGSGRCRPNVGLSCRAWSATSGPACAEPRAPAGSSVVGEETAGMCPESCCRDCRVGRALTVRVEVSNL